MGGSSGGGPSRSDLEKLEQLAKKTLREREDSGRRNVFISFAHEDLAEVNLLRGQARNGDSNLEFNDWSLREPFDSKRADYIKQGIRERIKQSSATLVYVSEKSASSRWVDWEIRESIALGKKVVVMYKGELPRSLPPAAVEFKDQIKFTPWTHKGIAKALE